MDTVSKNAPIKLYASPFSGHAHRVELLLLALGLPYEIIETDAAARKTPEYRKINPLGQVPVVIDGDYTILDSAAILVYLATKYDTQNTWLPTDLASATQIQRWFSVAAGELRFGPARARAITHMGYDGDLARAQNMARMLFQVLDQSLSGREWFVGTRATVIDLTFYAYVRHAPEGGISLEPYPALRQWLGRVEAFPWFKPLPTLPIPTGT